MITTSIREYSAKIEMHLELGELQIPIWQLCGEFIITRHPFSIPPSTGVIVLKVDDQVFRSRTFLPDGIDPDRSEQPILTEQFGMA